MNKKTIFLSVLGILIIIIGFFFLDKVFTANAVLDESIVYTTEQMAVYRPSTGDWHIRREDGSTTNYSYGDPGDIPIPADYDGDGLTDIAIYRPSTLGWSLKLDNVDLDHLNAYKLISGPAKYYKISNSNENIPVPEDYDYDGTDDLAVFNPRMGNWVFVDGNGILQTVTFGDLESLPIPADYDGDGKVNLATYKVGIWKILLGNGTEVEYEYGNADEHIPVPADYDGDGLTDIAFYNEDNGIGWIWFSSEEPDYLKESNLHEGSGNHGKYSWGGGEEWASPLTSPLSLRGAQRGGRNIGTIGPEESVGSGGRIPTIATDTMNMPHIASDVGGQGKVLLFNKQGNTWSGSSYNTGGSQFYNPRMEINEFNQAWISGVKWWPDANGLIYIKDIASDPSVTNYVRSAKGGHCCLPIGLISIDPLKKDECIFWAGNGGYFERFGLSGDSLVSSGTGYMESGQGGEVSSFAISKNGNVLHQNGEQKAVWHAATGVYQNSLRDAAGQPPIAWSNFMVGGNSGTGDDGEYMSLTTDLENSNVAYIASSRGSAHNRAIINIFDGSSFRFGPSEHHTLDSSAATFGNGIRRFAPQLTPAQGGGAFVCWTHSNNHIYIKYISSQGKSQFGETVDVGAGNMCAITTDSEGQIHIAYNNGGVKYRKIQTS